MSEGTKHDADKVPVDLWSPTALEETSKVLAFGADKYEAYNWANGIRYSRVFAASLRHLWAWWRGEDLDQETGLHHLAHAMCCLMFLLHYVLHEYKEFDDRPEIYKTRPRLESTGGPKEELGGSRGQRREDSQSTFTGITEPGNLPRTLLDVRPSSEPEDLQRGSE